MNEEHTGQATRKELAQGLRDHYEKIATEAHHWSNQIPKAIDMWEKWPELEAELTSLRSRLAEVESNHRRFRSYGKDRLISLVDSLMRQNTKLKRYYNESANTVDELRKENKEWSEAIDCWAKTPQGLRDEMEEMEKEIKDLKDDLKEQTPEATQWYIRKLQDQLATAQAQLRRKDEALETCKMICVQYDGKDVIHSYEFDENLVKAALADGKEGGE